MADFTGGPGLLAFIATFTMVGATILLFRSLGKHLRKVRTHPPEAETPAAAGSANAASTATNSALPEADPAPDDGQGTAGGKARRN